MPDFVMIDADTVTFQPQFGAATVAVQPGTLKASGKKLTVDGTPVCVKGDEASVRVENCSYVTPDCAVPGVGALSIDSLAGDQVAAKMVDADGKAALLKGSTFKAVFKVSQPAKRPPPNGSPDTTPQYNGSGSFAPSANTKVKSA